MTWSAVELQGPPPASRLDLAVCVVPLRVPRGSPQAPGSADLASTSGHAKEVLERELKPGSASSRDSWTDVNASEAFFPIEPTEGVQEKKAEEPSARAKGDQCEEGGAAGGEVTSAESGDGTDTVHVLLLNGGMDTEGEIFDDTLVFRLL